MTYQINKVCLRCEYRKAMTLIETLVVIAIGAMLLALLLPAIQRIRDAAYRTQCRNNLRQVGIGAQHYNSIHGHFPTGSRSHKSSEPRSSWIMQMLPQLGQDILWQRTQEAFRKDTFPFHNPPHIGLATVLPIMGCTADVRVAESHMTTQGVRVAFTSYLGVSGDGRTKNSGVLFFESKIRPDEIVDGASNTLLIGERPPSADLLFGWWYAGNGMDGMGNGEYILNVINSNEFGPPNQNDVFHQGSLHGNGSEGHFWSLHFGGAHFLMCDGSVHFLSYAANSILPALATRAGNEAVELP